VLNRYSDLTSLMTDPSKCQRGRVRGGWDDGSVGRFPAFLSMGGLLFKRIFPFFTMYRRDVVLLVMFMFMLCFCFLFPMFGLFVKEN